jgi:hypothetical protein
LEDVHLAGASERFGANGDLLPPVAIHVADPHHPDAERVVRALAFPLLLRRGGESVVAPEIHQRVAALLLAPSSKSPAPTVTSE